MTCVRIPNGFVCLAPRAVRLKRKGTSTQAYYMEMHAWRGPTFFKGKGNCQRDKYLEWYEVPDWVWAEYYKLNPKKSFTEESFTSEQDQLMID